MDIEAIVKKHRPRGNIMQRTTEEMLRAALTELAKEYETVASVTKMNSDRLLRKANERIRQLESERVPDAILEIGRRLIADAMNNDHCTAHPMFCVEKRRIVTGIDTDYTDDIAWIDEDGNILDDDEAAPMEAAFDETGEVPDGYTRTGCAEEWKHVDTYLTPQAAEARIDGGKDGRVNVNSAYRNSEMRAVREFLMALAAAPANEDSRHD